MFLNSKYVQSQIHVILEGKNKVDPLPSPTLVRNNFKKANFKSFSVFLTLSLACFSNS